MSQNKPLDITHLCYKSHKSIFFCSNNIITSHLFTVRLTGNNQTPPNVKWDILHNKLITQRSHRKCRLM